jgi:hypothetical protein
MFTNHKSSVMFARFGDSAFGKNLAPEFKWQRLISSTHLLSFKNWMAFNLILNLG